MQTENCLFCKIVAGQIPSSKFWEDENYIAILDINPNTKGATLVLSKKHLSSDFFKLSPEVVSEAVTAAQKVSIILSDKLAPSRVALVTEGIFIDHLHLKLYPLYNVESHRGSLKEEKVYFENYPGYITTLVGPEWGAHRLSELRNQLLVGS